MSYAWEHISAGFRELHPADLVVRIHASRTDTRIHKEAVVWLGQTVSEKKSRTEWADEIESHELMAIFGGPPHRDPLFFTRSCKIGVLGSTEHFHEALI